VLLRAGSLINLIKDVLIFLHITIFLTFFFAEKEERFFFANVCALVCQIFNEKTAIFLAKTIASKKKKANFINVQLVKKIFGHNIFFQKNKSNLIGLNICYWNRNCWNRKQLHFKIYS
jgi:hypothetical protein